MKNKLLVPVLAVVAVLIIVGLIVSQSMAPKKAQRGATPAKGLKAPAIPAKKAIAKDRGGLIVKLVDSKGKEVPAKIRAFKMADGRSSVYEASFVANKMQELVPGAYDLEIDVLPQRIYKNVNVAQGRENVEDVGCLTGALTVKMLNAKKIPAAVPVRVLRAGTPITFTSIMTNKSAEIAPGTYDLEIATAPRTIRKNVKIAASREEVLDLGMVTGIMLVKVKDESGKDARASVRVLKAGGAEAIAGVVANRPAELVEGQYTVEVTAANKTQKRDVKIEPAAEAVLEFVVAVPPSAPAKPKK